jgi:hypothetical protein
VRDDDKVLAKTKTLIEALLKSLPEDVVEPVVSRKRPLATDDSNIDWEQHFREGTLSKCKVPEIKSKLRSIGVAISNKNKAALLKDLEQHLEETLGKA